MKKVLMLAMMALMLMPGTAVADGSVTTRSTSAWSYAKLSAERLLEIA